MFYILILKLPLSHVLRVEDKPESVPVKLDTLVNLIDTVTDEMVSFKEKVCKPVKFKPTRYLKTYNIWLNIVLVYVIYS